MKTSLQIIVVGVLMIVLQSCIFVVTEKKKSTTDTSIVDSTVKPAIDSVTTIPDTVVQTSMDTTLKDTAKNNVLTLPKGQIDTRGVSPKKILEYAHTLIGVKYRYGSTNPAVGFDCSGFITHVFSRFDIVVPRSSIDFTNVGKEVGVADAKPGDLILFTGTNPHERFVGHMGIIVSNENGMVNFIHSTSGKAYGVTTTPLTDYYKNRYVKTIRIFPESGI